MTKETVDMLIKYFINQWGSKWGLPSAGKWVRNTPGLTEEDIIKHVNGEHTIAIHDRDENGLSKWFCLDIDCHDGSTEAISKAIETKDIFRTKDRFDKVNFLIEQTGTRDDGMPTGFHVWALFEKPVPVKMIQDLARVALKKHEVSEDVEIFPKKKRVHILRLPMGKHAKGGLSHWIDGTDPKTVKKHYVDPERIQDKPDTKSIHDTGNLEWKPRYRHRELWPCLEYAIHNKLPGDGNEQMLTLIREMYHAGWALDEVISAVRTRKGREYNERLTMQEIKKHLAWRSSRKRIHKTKCKSLKEQGFKCFEETCLRSELSNPAGITSNDNNEFLASKLGNHILENERFIAVRQNSLLWKYNPDKGIWEDSGEEWIATFVTDYMNDLGYGFKRSLFSAIQTFIRNLNLHPEFAFRQPSTKITLANGVYDMSTGEFVEDFMPEEYHLSALPVVYDPNAKCLKIEEFLPQVIPDNDDRPALVEFLGYCLIDHYRYELWILLAGGGANGKSRVIGLMRAFLGPDSVTANGLYELSTNRFRPARLFGKRANLAGDISPKALERTDMLKSLTGGEDTISAEWKGKDGFDFYNTAKLIFASNEVPDTDDDSYAFHRRARIIDFPNVFEAGDPNTDPHILDKLTTDEELSGLFLLAVEGWKRLEKNGKLTGEKSFEEKKEKWARKSNAIKFFVRKFCSRDRKTIPIKSTELYNVSCEVADKLNLDAPSDRAFPKELKRFASYADKRATKIDDKKQAQCWHNIMVDMIALNDFLGYKENPLTFTEIFDPTEQTGVEEYG